MRMSEYLIKLRRAKGDGDKENGTGDFPEWGIIPGTAVQFFVAEAADLPSKAAASGAA